MWVDRTCLPVFVSLALVDVEVLVVVSSQSIFFVVILFLLFLCVKPNDTKDGVWQTTCKEGECVGKDKVKLSFKRKSGIAELRKQLLRVTFSMAYYPVNSLLIECGSRNFRSLQRYPDVLCGKCADRLWLRQLPVLS